MKKRFASVACGIILGLGVGCADDTAPASAVVVEGVPFEVETVTAGTAGGAVLDLSTPGRAVVVSEDARTEDVVIVCPNGMQMPLDTWLVDQAGRPGERLNPILIASAPEDLAYSLATRIASVSECTCIVTCWVCDDGLAACDLRCPCAAKGAIAESWASGGGAVRPGAGGAGTSSHSDDGSEDKPVGSIDLSDPDAPPHKLPGDIDPSPEESSSTPTDQGSSQSGGQYSAGSGAASSGSSGGSSAGGSSSSGGSSGSKSSGGPDW